MVLQRMRPRFTFFVLLVLTSFSLNWLWEMLQMPAYAEMAGLPWGETFVTCTVATAGDVAITLLIYGVGVVAARIPFWGINLTWNVYVTGALLGGATACVIEWRALTTGRWSYTPQMPIVPFLHVGLWPFLQLTLLVPFSFFIAAWWTRRACRKSLQGDSQG